MLPVTHHTVSGVTTIAAFIVMRCATRRMTVEMEVMRKRSSVSKSQKGEGKRKAPSCLQSAKCTSGISVCSIEAWAVRMTADLHGHCLQDSLNTQYSDAALPPFFLFHLNQMLESSLRKWEQILNSGLSPTWKTKGFKGFHLFKDEVWSLFSLELLIVNLGMGTSQCPAEKLMLSKAALVFTGLI